MILKAHFKLMVKKISQVKLRDKIFWTNPYGLVNIRTRIKVHVNPRLALSGFKQLGADYLKVISLILLCGIFGISFQKRIVLRVN